VRIEKESLRAEMLAYDHLADPESCGATHGDVRIGDLAALDEDGSDLLVSEHIPRLHARIYRIAIGRGTTVLAEDRGVAYETGTAPYVPVEKTFVFDITGALALLPVPAKVEGIAILDPQTVLLALDNDYGFASDGLELIELPDVERKLVLLEVRSPSPLR